jgi:hypothetical protein
MEHISRDAMQALLQEQSAVAVSLYLPLHAESGPQGQAEGRVRFRNMLKKAAATLQEGGMPARRIVRLLAPAERLARGAFFREQHAAGLAVFLSDTGMHRWYLPAGFVESVVVGRRFHLQPLLQHFSNGERFFVLCLSQKNLRFLAGTASGVLPLPLDGTPTSIREALRYEVYPKTAMFLRTAQGRSRGNLLLMEGHGIGIYDKKDELFRYFRMVDRGIHPVLAHETAPLILAGVDYLVPVFRDAATYRHIVEESIHGNPDRLSDAVLHRAALALAAPYLRRRESAAIQRYFRLSGYLGRLTSDDQREIIAAAYRGRIETLFVKSGGSVWGRYVAATGTVDLHPQEVSDSEDLIDHAVVHTLAHGGNVYMLDAGAPGIPDARPAAAIFRY